MTPALFGRDHPAGVLRSEIGRATDSHGGLVLVTGEAGIGKSTLVTDAAHEARRRGALVVGGSCWDSDNTPGYWPWVQILRGLRRSATAAEWAAAQEASDGRLAALLGDPVRAASGGADVPGLGALPPPGSGEPPGTAAGGRGAPPSSDPPEPSVRPGPSDSPGPPGPSNSPGPPGPPHASGHSGSSNSPGPLGSSPSSAPSAASNSPSSSDTSNPPAPPGPPVGGPADGADTFGLFDAVTTALVTLSQSRPLVVVLDDLHSADAASLRLLEFVAQHAWFERLLLIGTYRDVEVEGTGHPLQPLILPLVSRATATLTLTGLGRDEVGALMAVTTGREPAPELVDEVHRRTGGNPFFVEQTARLWHSGSPVSTIPPGVREAVRQRLALLPEPVVSLLTSAALLGREFRRQVLAVVHGAPVPHVDRLLESAVVARVLVPRPTGQFAFAHDLMRETLYASLDDAEARDRHAAAVRALDAHGGLGDALRPGALARHAHLAGGALEPGRRIDLLLEAARDASGRLADEEAVGHYRRALTIASGSPGAPGEPRREPDLRRSALIGLDLAGQLRHVGERAEARRLLDRVVARARELDEPELLARVALTLYRDGFLSVHDASTKDLLAEAHRGITGKEGQDGLSDDRLAQELTIHIMAVARRGSDDEALAFSLWARHDSVWGIGSAVERLALTDELTVVGRRTGHQDMELHAAAMRWVALLELGDPAFHDQYRTFVRLTELTEMPWFALGAAVDTSLIASLQGRFAEAAAALERDPLSLEGCDRATFGFMGHHLHWALYLLRGHFAEAEEVLRGLRGSGYPCPGLLEAVTAVEQGDAAPALRLIAEHADRPAPYPRAYLPLWLRLLAQTAALTGDPRLIARAEDELTPYTGQWIVSLSGCDISGPVDLWLGMLAAARDDRDTAVAALAEAAASSDRLGARPWAVRSRLHLARALLARGDAADEACRMLHDVAREADKLALDHWASEATAALRAATAPAPAPAPASAGSRQNRAEDRTEDRSEGPAHNRPTVSTKPTRPVMPSAPSAPSAHAEFRRNGPVWQLGWDGVTVHVPDAKGLRDLHSLLGLPGTDVPAVRLLAPEGGELVLAAAQLGGDPVLDDEAKRRYKQHLDRLDAATDRASARGDARQVEAYDRERRALLDELRTAAGLGGRTRRLGDQTERARKTVTARIRDTLRKLDPLHPALAAHLRESVTTGTTCAYRPDPIPDWHL
ncbi:ATP-binding protein [Streptomyces californicus]|uniref:ATP-binding protein n=1 Tax=Streptomyces californicus TaxID=67351 RepID=UPI0037AD5C9E